MITTCSDEFILYLVISKRENNGTETVHHKYGVQEKQLVIKEVLEKE